MMGYVQNKYAINATFSIRTVLFPLFNMRNELCENWHILEISVRYGTMVGYVVHKYDTVSGQSASDYMYKHDLNVYSV